MNDQMPAEPKKNNTIIIVGVAVVLCCLCIFASVAGYYVWNNF